MSSETVEKPTAIDSTIVPKSKGLNQRQLLNKLYALPVPLRTYSLPTFVPHNPLSLFHIAYTWIIQTLYPPSSHPDLLYEGCFCPQSQSVHVTNHKTIRALWEQGFFGKGSLSRSEPSWLEREKQRRGNASVETAEERTRQRRAERQRIKWERARKEREAIDQKLAEERQANQNSEQDVQDPLLNGSYASPVDTDSNVTGGILEKTNQPGLTPTAFAPVDPTKLLLLPNSDEELFKRSQTDAEVGNFDNEQDLENMVLVVESLTGKAKKGDDETQEVDVAMQHTVEMIDKQPQNMVSFDNLEPPNEAAESRDTNGAVDANGALEIEIEPVTPKKQVKSPKSVRFCPTTEQTEFAKTSPRPNSTPLNTAQVPIAQQEHLQLTMEESFFLSYGLGVLKVLDPATEKPISNTDLLRLCRMTSYFPSTTNFTSSPDDPFMLSYVVYHHFRSLGWVVRGGIKFAVDFLLYNRGPVFSHAEFAIQILPSYSHPYWSADEEITKYVKSKEKKDWHWLHCINRVNGQVKKTLVLVYVDIPPPINQVEEEALGIDGILGRYGIREVVLRRWLFNRMRQ